MYLVGRKSVNFRNGKYIIIYLGNDIWDNRPRIFYLREKAKGRNSTAYRYRVVCPALFHIERTHAYCRRYYSNCATLFCENIEVSPNRENAGKKEDAVRKIRQ